VPAEIIAAAAGDEQPGREYSAGLCGLPTVRAMPDVADVLLPHLADVVAEDVFMAGGSVLPEHPAMAIFAACPAGLDPAMRVLTEPARFIVADRLSR
jgi:hypothetical protein